MANDRMFLVHKPSGYAFRLAKYYPSTWYGNGLTDEKLNEWFELISQCREDNDYFGGGGEEFIVVCESSSRGWHYEKITDGGPLLIKLDDDPADAPSPLKFPRLRHWLEIWRRSK
jgi:hypothetical protein